MGMIDWRGIAKMQQVDYKAVNICKIIEGTYCMMCREKINRGSFCLGRGSQKVCLDCSEKFLNNVKEEINNFMSEVNHTESVLNKNMETYKTNNLVSNI